MPKSAKEVLDVLKNRDPKEVAAILSDREAWIVNPINVTKTVPVGTALYVMWTNDEDALHCTREWKRIPTSSCRCRISRLV